jgi:hypothetical protein
MLSQAGIFKGVVRGNTIELEGELNIPDGQEVTVIVRPPSQEQGEPGRLPPGEGIRRSSGAWSDDPEGVDQFVQSVYERRRVMQRRPIEP